MDYIRCRIKIFLSFFGSLIFQNRSGQADFFKPIAYGNLGSPQCLFFDQRTMWKKLFAASCLFFSIYYVFCSNRTPNRTDLEITLHRQYFEAAAERYMDKENVYMCVQEMSRQSTLIFPLSKSSET